MQEAILAKFMYEAGAKVVGISDVNGALYNPKGLDIEDLMDRRDSLDRNEFIQGSITNEELLDTGL